MTTPKTFDTVLLEKAGNPYREASSGKYTSGPGGGGGVTSSPEAKWNRPEVGAFVAQFTPGKTVTSTIHGQSGTVVAANHGTGIVRVKYPDGHHTDAHARELSINGKTWPKEPVKPKSHLDEYNGDYGNPSHAPDRVDRPAVDTLRATRDKLRAAAQTGSQDHQARQKAGLKARQAAQDYATAALSHDRRLVAYVRDKVTEQVYTMRSLAAQKKWDTDHQDSLKDRATLKRAKKLLDGVAYNHREGLRVKPSAAKAVQQLHDALTPPTQKRLGLSSLFDL